MEWWLAAVLIFGGLILMFFVGMPIAFSFMFMNVVGVVVFWGGEPGLRLLIDSIYGSVTNSTYLAIPLFILMGDVLLRSGVGIRAIDILDKWLGSIPGRLALLSVAAGVLFGALSGSSMASTALFGKTLTPEMEKRGYKKTLSLGAVMAAGGLDVMIPPSGLSVLLGALAQISVAGILIGSIIPGLIMAVLYASYIIIRCLLQPSIAPSYKIAPMPLFERIKATVKYALPTCLIIFLVTGLILFGVATPSEAAALGCLGAFVVAGLYGKLTWDVVKESVKGSTEVFGMMLMIITGAMAFGQILAFSGASTVLINKLMFPASPIITIIITQAILFFLGTFMGPVSMMMISLPIFMPLISALGFDPVWFGVVMLLNLAISDLSPPVGSTLFVMQAVAPPGTTIGDIWRASIPFIGLNLIVLVLMIAFPMTVLWLPKLTLR